LAGVPLPRFFVALVLCPGLFSAGDRCTRLNVCEKMARLEISSSQVVRNSLLNFAGQVVTICVIVVILPLIIGSLGLERFGLLTLAWVVPEYFAFLDLGLGRASSKYVAEALGREDKEHVSRFAWTAVIVQMVIGCLGALALIGLAPFLTDHLLNVSPTVASEAKVMFALAALSIPVVLVSNSFIGFLAAGQRFDLVNGVSVSFNLLSLLLTFLGVLYFDWNLNDIVAALVVGRVLTLGVYYRLCTHVFSSFRRARFHPAELRRLLAFGGWITVSNAIVPILLYLDRFMIGASLTVTAVAYYSVPYEIVTRLWVIPTSLVATLFPAFSTLIGQRGNRSGWLPSLPGR
jgi:O-antigen/teichoic acid export membrane protein